MTGKPWREIAAPHENVLKGTFQEAEFAADLTKVVNGSAPPEYQDPSLFFERTYITEGMRLLLDSVARRMAGQGGDPVVQLQTAFGGGKTHAMLAVYHLAQSRRPARELPGIPPILDAAGISSLPPCRVAVLDGNALSASHPRNKGPVMVHTLWGEIAWQLGREEGYHLVEASDQDGTSPGKEILAQLFQRFSPCLVLMDETVAYVRQFEPGKSYAGGTFESNLSFLQALTEAAGHVPSAMVLASLPESNREAGGQRGIEALRSIEHLFRRVEAVWKPVSTEEGFEIVRRRIFAPVMDEKARDQVCRAFADQYALDAAFPAHTRDARYLDRLKAAYPIHPEVFDRLYEDWASLENFQRTRGVLRLMAMVVHRLWSDGNPDWMILPGSLPLYDTQVRNEMLRFLPQGWEPVMERDVDGARSIPTEIDEMNPGLGSLQAARRVARSIFLGSAPASTGPRIRGINAEYVRLGCAQPGQPAGKYDDALRHLADQLHYLYSVNDRYWYDTQTNLRREAESRMSRFHRDEHLIPELRDRLKSLIKGGPFTGVHVFTPHADIPDDQGLRLVVLSPVSAHLWHKENTLAIKAAEEIQQWRGSQPRLNQNRLIFLAADENTVLPLYEQAKRYLAWKSIIDEKDSMHLNLDQHRIKEANKNQEEAEKRLLGSLMETYKWILAPTQERNQRGNLKTRWEDLRIAVNTDKWMETIALAVTKQELIYVEWSPFHLRETLQAWYWKKDQRDYPVGRLWNDFCQYTYLPRLVNDAVLKETVLAGVQSTEFFGYATGKEEDRYAGLLFGKSGAVYMDDSSVLVHPDAAAEQIRRERSAAGDDEKDLDHDGDDYNGGDDNDGRDGTGGGTGNGNDEEEEQAIHGFYGSVMLKPSSAALDFSKICEEVIQHFSSKIGTKVTITVDIQAESTTGFNEAIIRTVKENSRALNFSQAEFMEE